MAKAAATTSVEYPKSISNWTAKRAGARITIEGLFDTGLTGKVTGIERIEAIKGEGVFAVIEGRALIVLLC